MLFYIFLIGLALFVWGFGFIETFRGLVWLAGGAHGAGQGASDLMESFSSGSKAKRYLRRNKANVVYKASRVATRKAVATIFTDTSKTQGDAQCQANEDAALS